MAAAVEAAGVGAGTVAAMSEEDLKPIVRAVRRHVDAGRGPLGQEAPFAGSADAKVAYAFILEVLARAVREGLDSATLQQQLQEAHVPAGHAQLIVTGVMPAVPAQRSVAPCSTALPALVQAGWRLDYVTRTSASGKVNQQQYVLRFVSRDANTGELSTLEVSASKAQVAALHDSVSQAVEAAEAFVPKPQKAKKAGSSRS